MKNKLRLDVLLVARGLADSRTKAQSLIMAGLVYHGEQKLDKAGAEFADDFEVTVRGKEHPWVSRGGMKLAKAIEQFKIEVRGKITRIMESPKISKGKEAKVCLWLCYSKMMAHVLSAATTDLILYIQQVMPFRRLSMHGSSHLRSTICQLTSG